MESPSTTPSDRNPARVLRNPNYRFLWTGSVVAALGSSIGNVVLTWVVFVTTHSPIDVALLGVVAFLPTVVFGVLAGALIDRVDRRRLMVTCDGARLIVLGGLALYTWEFGVSLAALLAAALLVATFGTLFRPATNAVIPRLLGAAEVTDGNGMLMAGSTIAGFVGSPVGGLLILWVGVVGGLAANALTFGFSGAMMFLMVVPALRGLAPSPTGAPPSLFSDVREGLRYLRSQDALLAATLAGMAANFFLAIFLGFQVVYASDQLHVGATGFGGLLAVGAAGWGIGALLPGRIGADRAPGLWYAGVWTAAGACVVGMGFVTSVTPAAILLLAFGILGGIGNTTFLTAVQRTVPMHLLGRYFATDEAGGFAMIPAGTILGGFLILALGVATTFEIAGLGAIVGSGVLLLYPPIRRWGSNPEPLPTGP